MKFLKWNYPILPWPRSPFLDISTFNATSDFHQTSLTCSKLFFWMVWSQTPSSWRSTQYSSSSSGDSDRLLRSLNSGILQMDNLRWHVNDSFLQSFPQEKEIPECWMVVLLLVMAGVWWAHYNTGQNQAIYLINYLKWLNYKNYIKLKY